MKNVKDLVKGELFYYGVHRDSDGEFEYRLQEHQATVSEMDTFGDGEGWAVWSHNKSESTDITMYEDGETVMVPPYASVIEAFELLNEVQRGLHQLSKHELRLLTLFVNWHK